MAGRFDVHAQTVEDEARKMWASSQNIAGAGWSVLQGEGQPPDGVPRSRWRRRSCRPVVLCATRDDPVPAARGAAAARERRALPIRAELRY